MISGLNRDRDGFRSRLISTTFAAEENNRQHDNRSRTIKHTIAAASLCPGSATNNTAKTSVRNPRKSVIDPAPSCLDCHRLLSRLN